MLELRPSCEHCNKQLPPDSTEAYICSFECTFCADCVESILQNVCPHCGGGFSPRPTRPVNNLKNDNFLGKYPATRKVTQQLVDIESHKEFSKDIKGIPPAER